MCFAQNFGRILNSLIQSRSKIKAFTLAEVLITLAIIGVVAVLTIPTVVQNYQKKMYVTQLKKSYNNITNGFKTYMGSQGVTKLSETEFWVKLLSYIDNESVSIEEVDNELKNEFLKIFKISKAYNPDENNYPETQRMHRIRMDKNVDTNIDYGIFLADGSWIEFWPDFEITRAMCDKEKCSSLNDFQTTNNTPTKLWEVAGYINIDVNGAKGPNTIGRDVFGFYLGNDGVLYPLGGKDYSIFGDGNEIDCSYDNMPACAYYWEAQSDVDSCDPERSCSDGWGCSARIMEDNWQMKY